MSEVKSFFWDSNGMETAVDECGQYVLCTDYLKLEAEIDVLKGLYAHSENVAFERLKRLEYLSDEMRNSGKFAQDQEDRLAKLTHQRDTLKKCAEFYADPENYILRNIQEGEWTTIMPASDKEIIRNYKHPETDWVGTINVCGKTARKALQDVEESEID